MRSTAFLIRSSLVLALVSAGVTASAQTASAPPTPGNGSLSAALRDQYNAVKLNVTEAAAKMTEADYGFRPVDTVRTFGAFVGHIADANLSYCALAKGDKPEMANAEKLTTKAELVAALAKAVAYCDEVYGAMTDEKALAVVKAGRTDMPVAALLFRNVSHTNEHYGNLVTYMRIKGLVPPSTERAQQQRR